ncbi:unnamed protein product [Angiostrongylus costaricensis]|uniref:Lactamase_B domain-containing protein n=1 Tax=Angiostrongylus costaricensis TaxID=334426 RepID=A0A0R3PZ58_ANGCS|nr:unnamed protein product [Angiostrongylus costaricensis]
MYDKEYAFCRPSIIADCPVGYLCDQSFVLGRSICCHDKRLKPQPNRPPVVQASSIRSPFTWNKITPTAPPKWNVRTTVKKAPWYIKNGSTWPSGGYSRVTPEVKALTTEDSTVASTVPSTTITSEQWVDGQSEAVGAITLINDNGFHVLVDTGASSDAEGLLHSLSKEGVTADQINTVVITHGHPGHMGNMNFFGQKPIIFNSMEYIGRHVTPTALTERDILDQENIWDSAIKRQNANLIICMADWIIPGHGQPFRVLPGYRCI